MIKGPTHLFGDNGSVVTNASLLYSPLRKRHHALSYHYTRESIASGAIDFQFLPGHMNPADILSKHWGYQQVWSSALRPLLFWKGDTGCLLEMDDGHNGTDEPRDSNTANPTALVANPEPSKGECQISEKFVVHPAELA